MIKQQTLLILLLSLVFPHCSDPIVPKPAASNPEEHTAQIKDQFIRANQQLLQKESEAMDYYAKTHKLPFVATTTGIRYYVYKASEKGDSIRAGMLRIRHGETMGRAIESAKRRADFCAQHGPKGVA